MKKIDNKKVYMIFGIVILIIAIAGSAYAYYSATASATISGTAGGGNLTINVRRVSTSANDSLIPLDNDITTLNKAILGEGNTSNSFDSTKSCIDKNGLTACQVYKIIISNNSSVSISLNGGVSLKGSDTPNIECAVMDNDSSISNNKSCKGSKTLANKYSLNANTTKEYYILVYIKNINGVQTDTGNFTGTITFTSSDGNEVKARFNDDPALTTLTNLGLEVDTEHTPLFTTVSGNSGVKYVVGSQTATATATGLGDNTNGIYEAEDDLGTSYYFRGNVDNNLVYFANLWWRIIRINGDGTIRMIYAPSTSDYEEYLVHSSFNSNSNDNAYVGYMYGTAGSSTYNDTHKNTNNSTIKGMIDTWYQDNLSDYSQYIADAIYCNDREVINNFNLAVGEQTMSFTGNGSGTTQTVYAFLKRNNIDHNPTLKCTNTNDRFTTSSSLGNGALTYPIGLITADEVVMGGGYGSDADGYITNDSYYLLDNGGHYLTMTPFVFQAGSDGAGGYAYVGYVSVDGYVSSISVNNRYSRTRTVARPVVTLVSNAISGGEGTSSNPFYVGSAPSTSYIPFVVKSNPDLS